MSQPPFRGRHRRRSQYHHLHTTWQTGAGVPSARTGRYTPDVSFSASSHDGYFAAWPQPAVVVS